MNTITDSFGVYQQQQVHNYTSDDRSEQAIWNVRPKQRSGDTTPIERLCVEALLKKVYPEVSLKYLVAVDFCKKELVEFLSVNDYAVRIMLDGWMAKVFDIPSLKMWLGEDDVRRANDLLEPFMERFPTISKADLFQLASCVSAKLAVGADIPFHPGRKDKDESSNSEESYSPGPEDMPISLEGWKKFIAKLALSNGLFATKGIYPPIDPLDSTSTMLHPWIVGEDHYEIAQRVEQTLQGYKEHITGNVFPKTRQTSNKELLIFHCIHYNMGDIDEKGSRIESPLTSKPRIDNSYCKELLTRRKEGHLLSPTDKKFLQDPVLHFLVKKYAADLNVFLADFTQAFVRLSELEFAVV